jgi:hypothetical protein
MFCALVALGLIALRAGNDKGPVAPASAPVYRRSFGLGWQNVILLSWAILPFLAGYILTIATERPILYDRYLIGSLSPALLLAARGLSVLRFNRPVLAGALAIVAACAAPAAYGSVAWYNREDMRTLIVPSSSEVSGDGGE